MSEDKRRLVFNIIKAEIPDVTVETMATPFDKLSIDSFGFISMRARLEHYLGFEIDDEQWMSAICPEDILKITLNSHNVTTQQIASDVSIRSFNINMPQMAMSGLSESWLFKELGDMHWNMITDGLGSSSSELIDGSGSRLYATFTRISFAMNALSSYEENSHLKLRKSSFSRFGSGLFFSEIDIIPGGRANLMSSFTKRKDDGSNLSLQKGQPKIPEFCSIPSLEEYPSFAMDYKTLKAAIPHEKIFETEYEIVPQHDINGVGLLYFATYPMISDICLSRYTNMDSLSTDQRDVFYFGNCDRKETLVFRIHSQTESGASVQSKTSISRKSDGELMAFLVTTHRKIGK